MAKRVIRYSQYSLKIIKIKYEDLSIDTYVLGNGPRKIFVFLPIPHGGLMAAKLLDASILDQVTLISFNIPGWAGNPYTGETIPMYKLANIAKQIAKQFRTKRYSVIGFEYGASVATILAGSEENVQSVVLVNPIFRRSLVEKRSGILSNTLRILPIVLKSYYLIKYRLSYEKGLLRPKAISNLFSLYATELKSMNSKIVSESLNRYYSSDLSLYLNGLSQSRLMVLSNIQCIRQVEYLKKVVGREKVESYQIEGGIYPLFLDEKALRLVMKFLLS